MDLDFTEEQQMLRETVRRLCEEHTPIEAVRRLEDDPTGYPVEMWKQMGELGILGLLISESCGGSGMSAIEGAIARAARRDRAGRAIVGPLGGAVECHSRRPAAPSIGAAKPTAGAEVDHHPGAEYLCGSGRSERCLTRRTS